MRDSTLDHRTQAVNEIDGEKIEKYARCWGWKDGFTEHLMRFYGIYLQF